MERGYLKATQSKEKKVIKYFLWEGRMVFPEVGTWLGGKKYTAAWIKYNIGKIYYKKYKLNLV